ncbi:GLPGLI family protein [Empedobacter brevis]|uniref:GLPGLI family protein n=1 Tax=Empedobacter brevis TaxID=247 RepID=UPI0039B070A4
MKKILSLFTILFVVTTHCQEKLYIEYEFRNEFDISNVKDSKNKELYKNSNDNRLYFELLSSQNESIFKRLEKVDNSQNRTGTSISFTSGPGGIFYKNFINKLTISEINYNGKNLLINDSIKIKNWILEKDRNEILGFEVKKATVKVSENSYVEAWYAPKLVMRNGPSNYDGLPGIILKLIISNKEGNQVNKEIYLATEVKLNDKIKIIQPTKGKQINKSDFDKLVEEDNRKFNETFMKSIEVE